MEFAALTETRVFCFALFCFFPLRFFLLADRRDLDLFCIRKTQCQLIAVEPELERVAHRRIFHRRDLCPGDEPHVEKMLPQRTVAADFADLYSLPDFRIF